MTIIPDDPGAIGVTVHPLADGRRLVDLGWRVEIRTRLGKLVACTYRLDGGQWFARHRDGREETVASKQAARQQLYAWCDAAPAPDCHHEESLYGRCVRCGQTWEQQAEIARLRGGQAVTR